MKRLLVLTLCLQFLPVSSAVACDHADLCAAPITKRYPSLGRAIGISVDAEWIEQHISAIHDSFRPKCESFGNCLSVWGNSVDFCRLIFTADLRGECEKVFDMSEDLRGWQQCRAVADIFSMNQNRSADRVWKELQACAEEENGGKGIASPVVHIEPPGAEPGVDGQFVVTAFNPETGYPVLALVTVNGRMVGTTFQPFRYALRFNAIVDELGRISVQTPSVVVDASPARGSNAPPFQPVTVHFSAPIPETVLTFDPPPAEWTAGANRVRVTATDAGTGEVLAGRILIPGGVLGDAGEPVTIELRAGDTLCGDPVWFRPRQPNRSDESLPIPSCE